MTDTCHRRRPGLQPWRSAAPLAAVLGGLLLTGAAAGVERFTPPAGRAEALPRIAIIIDDIGYTRSRGERAARLPGRLSYAVLPHTPHGAHLATLIHRLGKEVLLHLPLQPKGADHAGEGVIEVGMSRTQVLDAFSENLESVPFAVGVSTHMGSLLSERWEPVTWLMQAMAVRRLGSSRLFIVDSRTSASSIMTAVAARAGVSHATRDVFLDNVREPGAIRRQLDLLVSLAMERGRAIGIGHPHEETLAVLEARLPRLAAAALVPISALLTDPHSPLAVHSLGR